MERVRHFRWDWAAAGISLLLLTWVARGPDGNLTRPGKALEWFYDSQAVSLMRGRIDVEPRAIAVEAFVRDGKWYGYFGPTPAIARIPLLVAMPGMYGCWSRISMVAASAVMLAALLSLLGLLTARAPDGDVRLRRVLGAVFVFAAAIGSTNVFLSAESKVYQESNVWGSALTLASVAALARFLAGAERKWLWLSCAAGVFAFFARVSSGAGAIAALAAVDGALLLGGPGARKRWGVPEANWQVKAALTATVVLTAVMWCGLNYWKFGSPWTAQPVALTLNYQFEPERQVRLKGSWVSLQNVPMTAGVYLAPRYLRWLPFFPWVSLENRLPDFAAEYPAAHFDQAEPLASLPLAAPELFFVALGGTALCFGRRTELQALRIPVLGAAAGGLLMFFWGVLTYRYLHDLFPWLAAAGAVGVVYLPAIRMPGRRYAAAGLFGAATVYAAWVNWSFAMIQQGRWLPL